jgi:hypothetical protein
VSARSIHPSVLIFFEAMAAASSAFLILPLCCFHTTCMYCASSKVKGISFAHGFSAFGPCPFVIWMLFCCDSENKKFGIFELALAQMMAHGWLLELALAASLFHCSLSFHSGSCSALHLHWLAWVKR